MRILACLGMSLFVFGSLLACTNDEGADAPSSDSSEKEPTHHGTEGDANGEPALRDANWMPPSEASREPTSPSPGSTATPVPTESAFTAPPPFAPPTPLNPPRPGGTPAVSGTNPDRAASTPAPPSPASPSGASNACANQFCFDIFDCYLFHPDKTACGFKSCEGFVCK